MPMTTTITITGTGTPIQTPDRAGPGVLIRSDDVALQFDAGRGTVMRLASAGSRITDLDALFVTHHHSDHIVGIPDLLMTRWLNEIERKGQTPLPIYTPEGEASRLVERMLDVWRTEMEMRQTHTGRPNVAVTDVHQFKSSKNEPSRVVEFGGVRVSAIAVDHEPVVPAVAYRIDTADGSVVISGDTSVCRQVEMVSAGADVLIHEAINADGLEGLVSDPRSLLGYHAEPEGIGAMAQRADVGQVVLTHLVPPPNTPEHIEAFADAVRRGGYIGPVIIANDLDSIVL